MSTAALCGVSCPSLGPASLVPEDPDPLTIKPHPLPNAWIYQTSPDDSLRLSIVNPIMVRQAGL